MVKLCGCKQITLHLRNAFIHFLSRPRVHNPSSQPGERCQGLVERSVQTTRIRIAFMHIRHQLGIYNRRRLVSLAIRRARDSGRLVELGARGLISIREGIRERQVRLCEYHHQLRCLLELGDHTTGNKVKIEVD